MLTATLPTTNTPLIEQAFRYFEPRPQMRAADWICENVVMPNGRHFDPDLYPHVIASGGPCDAYDNHETRRISLMWASRLGKTAICHSLLEYQAHVAPCPMLFGTSTKDLATQIVNTKLYPMLEFCEPLRDELKPKARRKQTRIDLLACRIFIAWSGSATTLADISAKVAHANEVDKWDADASNEADPLELFFERCKEFPNRKELIEGTPTVKRHSRIERALLSGTNRRFLVPCPHCGEYRQWKKGNGDPEEGGIVWDRENDKRSDPDLARKTARYVCEVCHNDVWSHQRAEACRNGVWVPDGCIADSYGKLVGEPARSPIHESYQLSSLYALSLSWGDIAEKFVRCKGNPRELQNFVNSWQGETWEVRGVSSSPAEVVQRLCLDYHATELPSEVVFLTRGVDVQQTHLVWEVWGWGPGARGWLVDYGTFDTFDQLAGHLGTLYHGDGRQLCPGVTFIDSGHDSDTVYKFCRDYSKRGQVVLPIKGISGSDQPFRLSKIGDKPKHAVDRRQDLVLVDSDYWNEVIQKCIDTLAPTDDGGMAWCSEVRDDPDFVEQCLNEALMPKLDTKNYEKLYWSRIDENVPNDFRDAWRYARAAAEFAVRRAWNRVRAPLRVVETKKEPPKPVKNDRISMIRSSRGNWLGRM